MDGTAGLAAIDRGNFDLVITDIWMPGTSGARIVRNGREKLPNTRFLVITGGDPSSRTPEDGGRLESFGADELLLKPFEKDELILAVSRLLDAAAC
jgi:YesN/AraC family two-component response regulator